MEQPRFDTYVARQSHMAQMPLRIAYIDYRSIGVHELPREANTSAVYDSISDHGYEGPPISAFFSYNDYPLRYIGPNELIEVSYGVVGVADGHNRLEAFHRLDIEGRLRSPIIPVQLIPAHNPRHVSLFDLANPHPEQIGSMCKKCLGTLSLIDTCHLFRGLIIKDISECFLAKLTDGTDVRVRWGQPDIVIEKDELLLAA
jgi:hypothetical protein